ncbi:MAG: TolC family protein, partial [Hyphomicrobiales bacterium]|nr:TolC family protein [Hyphomicrobiales bacterium]
QRISQQNTEKSLQAITNQVVREVNDAKAQYITTTARIAAAAERVNLSRLAYGAIQGRREMGESNQFEWILNMKNHIQAKLALLAAQIDHQRAKSGLRAAEGVIDRLFIANSVRNSFDRLRVDRLQTNHGLVYLGNH